MKAYIRDISTWAHLGAWIVTSYTLPEFSDTDENGSITVLGEQEDKSGNWLLVLEKLYYIEKSTPSDGMTNLTVKLPCHAFDRKFLPPESLYQEYGTLISQVIQDSFIDEADDFFAMPYLTVTNTDETSFVLEEGKDYYEILPIWKEAEKFGVKFTFTPAVDGLALAISTSTPATHNVFPNDGHTQIVSQAWSSSLIAKVTVYQYEKNGDEEELVDSGIFYWHDDGSVSSTPPDPRIRGQWDWTQIDTEKTLEQGAVEAMKSNTSSYKVEFYTDRVFNRGDLLLIEFPTGAARVNVSSSVITSNDNRRLIKCGTLVTTLTEAISKAQKGD